MSKYILFHKRLGWFVKWEGQNIVCGTRESDHTEAIRRALPTRQDALNKALDINEALAREDPPVLGEFEPLPIESRTVTPRAPSKSSRDFSAPGDFSFMSE